MLSRKPILRTRTMLSVALLIKPSLKLSLGPTSTPICQSIKEPHGTLLGTLYMHQGAGTSYSTPNKQNSLKHRQKHGDF